MCMKEDKSSTFYNRQGSTWHDTSYTQQKQIFSCHSRNQHWLPQLFSISNGETQRKQINWLGEKIRMFQVIYQVLKKIIANQAPSTWWLQLSCENSFLFVDYWNQDVLKKKANKQSDGHLKTFARRSSRKIIVPSSALSKKKEST